jgi:transcriptional regulator with XRE-family HTH domain
VKEFEVTIRVRNNLLKQRRDELGFTQAEMGKAAGIQQSAYCALETMRASPLRLDGQWRSVVLSLANFHNVAPEELFPQAIQDVKEPTAVRTVDLHELKAFAGVQERLQLPESPDHACERRELREALSALLPLLGERYATVLRLRYGLDGADPMTCKDVAKLLGVCGGRVNQMEQFALRKIRHIGVSSGLLENMD